MKISRHPELDSGSLQEKMLKSPLSGIPLWRDKFSMTLRKSTPGRILPKDACGRTHNFCTPGRIRTHNPQIRSLMLYPVELRARLIYLQGIIYNLLRSKSNIDSLISINYFENTYPDFLFTMGYLKTFKKGE